MLEDTEFQKFWTATYSQMLPGAMTNAFMEVAYKAWLAAYDIGVENGRDLDRELSNTEDNRYFR